MDSLPLLRPVTYENTCPGHAAGVPGLLFVQLVSTLLSSQCQAGDPKSYHQDYGPKFLNGEEFDFVVIGAGSSGSVIASRLSENKDWKVLLIEAGGDPTFQSEIPGFWTNQLRTRLDWKYLAEPSENYCLGMEDKRCSYPRGQVLGGSSTIGSMLYIRGNAKDFDEWEELGNPGWGYEQVLKYFKKSEGLEEFQLVDDGDYDQLQEGRRFAKRNPEKLWELSKMASENYHSEDGLLKVSHFYYDFLMEDLKQAVLSSAEQAGHRVLSDVNGRSQLGFTESMATVQEGARANTAKIFLNPFKDRENLFVIKKALAQKLIVKDGKVEGVEFKRNGTIYNVNIRKEVIVSAGTINSPQLLLLSGIGPKTDLQDLGIASIVDLPGVGQNLQDHVAFIGSPYKIDETLSKEIEKSQQLDGIYEFLTRGSGIYANIEGLSLTGFIDSTNSTNIPDIQMMTITGKVNDTFILSSLMQGLNINDDLSDQFQKTLNNASILILAPTLLRPESRGYVKLKTIEPTDHPIIVPNFLNEESDVETLLRGIEAMQKIMEGSPLQGFGIKPVKLKIRDCSKLKGKENRKCLLRHLGVSFFDPVGTCKMGPAADPLAVVDHRLKVRGLQGLRVADGSVMPLIVRGNTNAAAIMIGEKAADLIKEDWTNQQTSHTEL